MMLTIHGLSPKTRYQDLKLLIKQECGIEDFILDNLQVNINNGLKKVRVGLPDDNEGYKLMKCLDGYRTPGNYLLRVTQVGKPAVNVNSPAQESYNPRPGYPQQRDTYSNQSRSDYNRSPQGPIGIQRPSAPYGPGGQQGRVDNAIPSPWASNNITSQQWGPNSSVITQIQKDRLNFGNAQHNVTSGFTQQNPSRIQVQPEFHSFEQGRQGPPVQSSQNYGGYAPETNLPPHQMDARKNVRPIETVVSGYQASGPIHAGRYPDNQQYQPAKPGPTEYNINHPSGQANYAQQNSSQWQQSHQANSKLMSKGGPYERSFEDGNYLQGQSRDLKDLQSRPNTSNDFDKRRGFSPSARDVMQRRISPSRGKEDPGYLPRLGEKRRIISPVRLDDLNQRRPSPIRMVDVRDRRVSPQGRREDIHGRRFSPSEKRMSPGGRHHMASRNESPPRRMSPSRRQMSPGRRDVERHPPRFSPNRHHADKITNRYEQDKTLKNVRPAYEPVQSLAQNEAMYSGGFRPNIQGNVQYSGSGMRQEQSTSWPRHKEDPIIKKQEHERMDERVPLARGRIIEKVENRYSPTRKSRSRSSNRRDRSPIRDRYKRISRSPRSSHSPRRSWALEKRNSPDAPPPPMWPGQTDDNPKTHRHNFPNKDVEPVSQPVWENRSFKEQKLHNKRQYEEAKMRIAKDLERNPQGSNQERNLQKFSPTVDYDEHRDSYRGRNLSLQKIVKDDLLSRHSDEGGHHDYSRRRTSPYRDTRKGINSKDFDKDLEDIYQRALQFKKKTEELKKSASKKGNEFEVNRRPNDSDRDNMQQRYEGRQRHHGADPQFFRERGERSEEKPRDERALRDDRLQEERRRDDGSRDERLRYDRPRDDRQLDNRLRDDRQRDDRLREDRLPDYRPRDDKFHDDKSRTEIKQNFNDASSGVYTRNTQQDNNKNIDDPKATRILYADKNIKQKRDRAVNEIAEKIIERSEEYKHIEGDHRKRILEKLKLSVARIVYDMFGDSDMSFIEIIIKYQAKYNLKDEENLLREVVHSLPKPVRNMKRHSTETSDHPTKVSRYPESINMNAEPLRRPKLSDSSFNLNLAPPSVVSVPCIGMPQPQAIVNQALLPMMVSAPFYQTFDTLQQNLHMYVPEPVPPVTDAKQVLQSFDYSEAVHRIDIPEEDGEDGFRLYLCKDDFNKITNMEADLLKGFIISQMLKASGQFQGWAPDFTLKGLQTLYRYEVVTKDEGSKNWFLSIDFSEFEFFDVVIYTKEELWYQRAAVWLPGHSRVRNIEPLEKLRLQNKKLIGVNIEKWKFVKKIVNSKGTRLYVDIPPSSARALEAHNMNLSYELQQVSVFLRAVAVDKNSFDAGLREVSVTDPAKIIEAIQNAPMPSLANDPLLVKIVLRGSKTLDLTQARKIKEIVVYHLFKYHQQDGINRTDFLKYGFLQPNYFAIMPLNPESKKWLMGCGFGKVNRQAVVVLGGEEDNTKFIKMFASIPWDGNLREQSVIEKLKHSNAGVKGINFNMWKPIRIKPADRKRAKFEVQIDMESVVTLSTMRYQLDYKESNRMHALYFSADISQSGLLEVIKKYKSEMTDSYDVANMDLDSGQSDVESNDDVVFLD